MAVIWSDLQQQCNDYIRNYTAGGVSQGNVDRAINRSIEYFQRRISLPSDRRIHKFYFTSDTLYYNLPAGFNEAIGLFYDTQGNNTPARKWNFRPDTEMLVFSGLGATSSTSLPATDSRNWGFSTFNQVSPGQIIMIGPNVNSPSTIDQMASTTGWTASSDASGLTTDSNIVKVGSSSLVFNVTFSAGTAIMTLAPTGVTYDLSRYITNNGLFQFYIYFGSLTGVTNVQLNLQSSAGNYYQGTMTANTDGTAWATGVWNKTGVYANNMTTVGSPVASAINTIVITFNITSSYPAATKIRINDLFATVPDYMDLIYYSAYKGYVTGSSPKTDILFFNYNNSTTNVADTLYFGDYAPDLIGPIAKKAAIELFPQLRQSEFFYEEYKKEIEEVFRIYGKIYPRKRAMNFGRSELRRDTI